LLNGSVDRRLVDSAAAGLCARLAGEAGPLALRAGCQLSLQTQAIALGERIDLLKNLSDRGPAHDHILFR
jgi:hypothetical protein